MLQEPAETPYDLRFVLFGFPVRISWTFWLGALVIGHSFALGAEKVIGWELGAGIGMGPLLVLWTVALFVSILIHELGHAFALRQQGIHSSVVLYHFGGLAIPIASLIPGRSIGRMTHKQSIWVSFAGPLAQAAAVAILVFLTKGLGYEVTAFAYMPMGGSIAPFFQGELIENPALFAFIYFFVYPSIFWVLLNLMPVWPLDGGQIMRSIMLLTGGNESQSLWISVATAGALAAYGFSNGASMMGIFFALFAVQSFQMLQQIGGRRY